MTEPFISMTVVQQEIKKVKELNLRLLQYGARADDFLYFWNISFLLPTRLGVVGVTFEKISFLNFFANL